MKSAFILVMVFFLIFCFIFGPLLAIWSLNVLFGLGIAYSLKTWFAALVLMGIVGRTYVHTNRK